MIDDALAAVIARMRADLDELTDARRFFHATYLRTTLAVAAAATLAACGFHRRIAQPLNYERIALSGFADPDQPELMNPYREKYFAAIADAWGTWSSAMAQDFASGAYTVGAISEETVRATDEYIAATDPPAALRRLLLEGRDDVLRALRCQARDRQAAV